MSLIFFFSFFFFLYIWNVSNTTEWYKNTKVYFFKKRKNGKTWVTMKNVHNGLGVKNMSDLVLKEIYGRYGTKKLTKEQIRRYKMIVKWIQNEYKMIQNNFEKYDNLSEN